MIDKDMPHDGAVSRSAPTRGSTAVPGKRTLVEQRGPVQARGDVAARDPGEVHRAASSGVAGSGQALPHIDILQRAFGRHDLSGIRAHVGGAAAAASQDMGAEAYATGEQIAFASSPDLHTAAHEAAHVVQQRAGIQLTGGVGRSGDRYEQQADDVADRVVRGEPVGELLDGGDPGGSRQVQRQGGADAREGRETAHWIITLRINAKLRSAPTQSAPELLEFPNFGAPLYYRGHWQNDPSNQPYVATDGDAPKFPLRWLEVEFRHPERPPVPGWVHSAVTHYPDNYPAPSEEALRQVAVTSGTAPTGAPSTGEPTATPSGVIPADQLEVVGAGLDVPTVKDEPDPQAMLAKLPRIHPFLVEGQGNGVNFQKSPNVTSVGPASRVSPTIAVIAIARGRSADYQTYEYIHHSKSQNAKVRRSDIWLACEFEAATYFVHAGATHVTDSQLHGALHDPKEAGATSGPSGAGGTSAGPGGDDPTATITAKSATLRRHAAVEPGDLPVGYLPTGAHVTVLMRYQSEALSGFQSTDTGKSNLWLYVEIPAGQVVQGSDGQPLKDPPQRAWLHVGATDLGGGSEPLSALGNDGADTLQMPANPPADIPAQLTPNMTSELVQMAKTQLVLRRFMTMTEYRAVAPDYYSNWTQQAVASFQLIAMPTTGLQNGILTPQTWHALFQTNQQTTHMSKGEAEHILADVPGAGPYQWDDPSNPYVYERLGSSSYWGPGILGGECTWFVRSAFPQLKEVRSGAGDWASDLASLRVAAPQAGDVMNLSTHVAIITGVSGDGKHISVIECNWNYSRAVDTRPSVAITSDMVFLRPRR